MQDRWYSDNRDLIKWGVLLRLAGMFEAKRVVQVAFYRPSAFGQLVIDGQRQDIPEEVIAHFRNLRTIGGITSKVWVTVFDSVFEDRNAYLQAVLALLPAFKEERCIIFLDPDTGLESRNPNLDHVLNSEVRAVWDAMKSGDVFAFYQHQTNRAGQPWIEPKRTQLATALGVQLDAIRTAHAPDIANDVVFFFTQKALTTGCSGRSASGPPLNRSVRAQGMNPASKIQLLKKLQKEIVAAIPHPWLFPERGRVKGFLGPGPVMLVAERPSTGHFGGPSDGLLYFLLEKFDATHAHLTDLIKSRGKVDEPYPIDMSPHRRIFDRELEIVEPTLIVTFGKKVYDLLQFSLAGSGITIRPVWHYAAGRWPGRRAAFQKQLRKALRQ